MDMSWHNDTAPAYAILGEVGGEVDVEIVRIWMEHPDPQMREEEETADRFMVSDGDVYDRPDTVINRYSGDDFAEAVRIARGVHEVHVLRTLAQTFQMADAFWYPQDYTGTPGLVPYASEEEANQQVERGIKRLLEICPEEELDLLGPDSSKLAIADLVKVAARLATERALALPVA
jgi:hypothetical protein